MTEERKHIVIKHIETVYKLCNNIYLSSILRVESCGITVHVLITGASRLPVNHYEDAAINLPL
jgi:hypothetical protein